MKRIFYFINDGIDNTKYINFFLDKLYLLDEGYSEIDIIDKFCYKIGQNNYGRINRALFIEMLSFISFCKKELNIGYNEIEWIYNESFILHNHDLYLIRGGELEKLSKKDTLLFNIRGNLKHHMFRILKTIGWNIYSINERYEWSNNDKLYCIDKLYNGNIKLYLKDIIIPYLQHYTDENISILYNYIKDNFSSKKIILKKSFGEMGNGVKAVNLGDTSFSEFKEILNKKYFNSIYFGKSFYITPFSNISFERRIYYTFYNGELQVYAAKQKNTDFDNAFELDSFELYKGINVSWEYVDKKEIYKNKSLLKYLKEIVSLLGYETGVIEIGILGPKDFVFFEVNCFGGPLVFEQDQKDMYDFNYDIIKNKFYLEK